MSVSVKNYLEKAEECLLPAAAMLPTLFSSLEITEAYLCRLRGLIL